MRLLLVVCLLLCAGVVRAEPQEADVRAAVELGLSRLSASAENYTKNRECFACHHQTPAVLCLSMAKRKGIKIDEDVLKHQIDFTVKSFEEKLDQVVKGKSVPGASTMAAYALFTLDAGGHEPDKVTAALVEYLLLKQREGAWPALTSRPPSEGSRFTNNALALRVLKTYAPTGESKEAGELQVRIDKAFAAGKEWLLKNKPADGEDRAFHLRGLVYAGAEQKEIDAARKTLIEEQREDGSWSQLPDREGDAYATGITLTALRVAGIDPGEQAFKKGIAYLLKTQRKDGAWIVETRSKPVQVFFDNGDPGGKSQFISTAATGWATLSLLEALPAKK